MLQNNFNVDSDYSAVLVNYSTGIDSTGLLYWATKHFDRSKIRLCYQDTGLEYDINEDIVKRTAAILGIRYSILRYPGGFVGLLDKRDGRFPDGKNRWCTSYLKRDLMSKWIIQMRPLLGEKVLYLTGERRDESAGRAKKAYFEPHPTTLKRGTFRCDHLRPVLDYEKAEMFAWGRELGIDPHPCYQTVSRCSCVACIYLPDDHARANMLLYPDKFKALVQSELKHGFTWKQKSSLSRMWEESCLDLGD